MGIVKALPFAVILIILIKRLPGVRLFAAVIGGASTNEFIRKL